MFNLKYDNRAMETKGLISFNINIDGKPLEKLMEVVSKGIGTLYNPRKIRKEADAQAYAIRVLERAKAEVGAETSLIEAETASRISQRIVAKEVRRQENIDTVVEMAAKNLEGKEVSDTPVEEDWASRFFDIVQDVSKVELKELWAKILAKEIERPSSYSLRTLEVIRNISNEEAILFAKFSGLVFEQEEYAFIYNDDRVLRKHGLNYYYLSKLIEAGLIQTGENVTNTFPSSGDTTHTHVFICGNKYIELTTMPGTSRIVLPIYILTQPGRELLELTEHKDNMSYLKDFAAFVKKANPTATVKYGSILERKGHSFRYTMPLIEL